jgi:very-short-patch-repair endonuclease
MKEEFLPRDKRLNPYSRNLRSNATKQENHLWFDFLRNHLLRFNRQRIIGDYIADFYCPKANLVIELDGSQHYEEDAIEYDKQRTDYLEGLGLKVIRFTNTDIDRNFDGVCEVIEQTLQSQIHST